MEQAKITLKASVESLQTEIATILSRLGSEYLVCLHRQYSKERQVKRVKDDVDFSPTLTRVKFALKASKLVEAEEEFQTLSTETENIVTSFKVALKEKILQTLELEVKAHKLANAEKLAKSLRMAIKAILILEPVTSNTDVHKFFATLLQLYEGVLLTHLAFEKTEFIDIYRRVHSLEILPDPLITQLPNLS